MASDRFEFLDKDLLEEIADYTDLAEIELGIPLLVERSKLLERVRLYHDLGVKVQSNGILIEVAVQKGIIAEVLDMLRSLGFDVIAISESAEDIPIERKQEILNEIEKLSMDYVFVVGSEGKDSRDRRSLDYTISKIQEALDLKSRKVIVEVPCVGGSVAPYGAQGQISWDTLNEIAGKFGPPSLIFDAPQLLQRTALILEFGTAVNLSGVPIDEVLTLEMQRLGLTPETLGLSRPVQTIEGPPAVKFVYHLIRTESPIDETTLILRSGLPRRTVQSALSYLVNNGFVREVADSADMRKHKFTIK